MKPSVIPLYTTSLVIPNDSSTGPWYWDVVTPANVAVTFDDSGVSGKLDVNFDLEAHLTDPSANVSNMGFVFTEVFFYPKPGLASMTQYKMNAIPSPYTATDANVGKRFGESYDPVSLPIGGVDYPQWTRSITNPLPVVTFPSDPRGIPHLHLGVQAVAAFNNEQVCTLNVTAKR